MEGNDNRNRSATIASQRLSGRARDIRPAPTLQIAARARRMKQEGIDVISFSTGEPDFDTPETIAAAGIEAIRNGFTHYTDATGIPELREAVATRFREQNGIAATADSVLVSSGGKHAIFNVLAAIIDPGDRVVIPSPYWVSYPSLVELLGGVPVIVPTTVENRYRMTPEDLRSAIGSGARCVIINSPNNPTGVMYTPEELREFAEITAASGAYLLSDELYEKITYGTVEHFSPGSISSLADQIITVNGVSKAWAMTGWRIGYVTGPLDVIRAAGAIQSQTTSNPTSISQVAALRAVTQGDQQAEELRQAFARRRDLMLDLIAPIPGIRYAVPDGAFYLYVDISELYSDSFADSLAVSEFLLETEAVAVVPGIAFGDDRGMRISYACSDEEIRRGFERIRTGLAAVAAAG